MTGLEVKSLLSLEGAWCRGSRGGWAHQRKRSLLISCARTQVVTLLGSMVSDPSLGCSSLLKKILYYNNNNMNFSLFFLFLFCFSISFRD